MIYDEDYFKKRKKKVIAIGLAIGLSAFLLVFALFYALSNAVNHITGIP